MKTTIVIMAEAALLKKLTILLSTPENPECLTHSLSQYTGLSVRAPHFLHLYFTCTSEPKTLADYISHHSGGGLRKADTEKYTADVDSYKSFGSGV